MNVKTLCLGILHLGDATGYEIHKMVEGRFNHFVEASFGAIYPALSNLETEGLVTCREEQQSGKPGRKVYSLTERGRAALAETLAEPPRDDVIKSELLFVLRFAELVSRTHVSTEIDRRIGWLDGQLAELEGKFPTISHPAGRFCCGYGVAVYRAMRDYLAEHRHEVEALAGAQRRADQAAE